MTTTTKNYTNQENPITTEIIRSALTTAAGEMNTSLYRSAYSPIIYEMKDCSVGIFNQHAELLGQSAGLPLFLGNLDECIKAVTCSIGGVENYRSGDIYIMNDSYIAGTHLNDVTVISPIFYNEALVGFTANRADWIDIGAKDPGTPMDATEIYQEGLRIPPTKIYDAGEPRDDVINLLVTNCRSHDAALGDLNAQIAACRTGEKRYQEIIRTFGIETVERCAQDIIAQSERMDREAISKIQEGEYKAEGYMDNDGNSNEPVLVKVMVTVKGEDITIDLTGSSEQRGGPINCGLAQTISACRIAFKNLINPDSPVTGGNFRTLHVVAPSSTIFHAQEPAPCGYYYSPLGLLMDLIFKALSPAMKEKSVAAHYGDAMNIAFSGTNPKTNAQFLNFEATAGGWGGFHENDGQSGLICNSCGDFKNMPIEVFESKFPMKVTMYGLRDESGGAGYHRGGLGIVRRYEILADESNLYAWFERSKTPAWGLFEGNSGMPPSVVVQRGGDKENILKVNAKPLAFGDVITVKTGGGGGFGHPFDRDPNKVMEDVLDGYISVETALSDYGVLCKPGTLDIDWDGTSEYRNSNGK